MAGLDKEARSNIEDTVDLLLKDPKKYEVSYSEALKKLGIEPSLETVLSFSSGYILGLTAGHIISRYKRIMKIEEVTEFLNLMKRRAWELRQAFIGTRIEE